MNHTQAFGEISDTYNRARPSYPDAAVEQIIAAITNSPARSLTVADVGAGTGIFTRLLRDRLPASIKIVGVEPGNDMSRAAQQHTTEGITYINAVAESLPFETDALRAVTVAQAIQWFDRPAFLKEAARCLGDLGVLIILQNNRDWRASPFLGAYETLLEQYSPGYNRNYRSFDIKAEVTNSKLFKSVNVLVYPWIRHMPMELFRDMSLSSTKMKSAVAIHGIEHMVAAVDALIAQYFPADDLTVTYNTEVYTFQSA